MNILFLHSHNTGRYVQPMGHAVPTPNLQRLAEQGVLFRQAFAAAPTCSPSRASFMTGQYPHAAGMLGLEHRGFALRDPNRHIATYLRAHGYRTALAGVEHTTPDPACVGYDLVLSNQDTNYPRTCDDPPPDEAAAAFLKDAGDQPFFLSVGLNETHRPFPEPDPKRYPAEDARYCVPPRPLPDHAVMRADMAAFKASARHMDDAFGQVLRALDEAGLADKTLVCCFSDHGLQFARNMCTLTDHGIGVYLVVRGPGGFEGGEVCEHMASLIDLFPTACDVAGIEAPHWLQGRSLRPWIGASPERDDAERPVFAEINYHAAYEPTRCVRTRRYKYIRRFDGRDALVLSNVDDSPGKALLLEQGWNQQPREQEMLYDLIFDPDEMNNLVQRPACRAILHDMRRRLSQWMERVEDPLCDGVVRPPHGAQLNDPDQPSPKSPKFTVG